MLKTQIFGKEGKLSSEEKFWPLFSRIFECDKLLGTKCKGPKCLLAITVQVNRLVFGPKGSLQTNISSHSCFHRDIKFWPVLRRIIECDKPQETIYTGPQATFTNNVEVIRSFV